MFECSFVAAALTLLYATQLSDPTNVEMFDFGQSNSEHSRHWFFKGKIVIDGDVYGPDAISQTRGCDVALKEGSLVQGFMTTMNDDSEDEDDGA